MRAAPRRIVVARSRDDDRSFVSLARARDARENIFQIFFKKS